MDAKLAGTSKKLLDDCTARVVAHGPYPQNILWRATDIFVDGWNLK